MVVSCSSVFQTNSTSLSRRLFLFVLVFKLRTSRLLGKHSTTWATLRAPNSTSVVGPAVRSLLCAQGSRPPGCGLWGESLSVLGGASEKFPQWSSHHIAHFGFGSKQTYFEQPLGLCKWSPTVLMWVLDSMASVFIRKKGERVGHRDTKEGRLPEDRGWHWFYHHKPRKAMNCRKSLWTRREQGRILP
jgi:hypothetical protein